MLLKFWGVRGSLPSPITPKQTQAKLVEALAAAGRKKLDLTDLQAVEAFVQSLSLAGSTVGGNTTCMTIELDDTLFIFDAGSGLRELGEALMDTGSEFAQKYQFYRGQGHAYLFFTHTHWDHIQGLPFFRPMMVSGNRFDIYHIHDHVPDALVRQMEAPVFPLQFNKLDADFAFHQINEGEVISLTNVTITSTELNHPGKAYAYRIESDDAAIVIATDSEYVRLDNANTKKYRNFYRNADVLVFDAMFSVRESFIKEDWGHSSALIGADIARAANVKQLYLFHHDPTSTDLEIMRVLQETREYLARHKQPPEVYAAQEEMVVRLGKMVNLSDFQIEDSMRQDILCLKLSGNFGPEVTGHFRQNFLTALQTHQADRVILNMENLHDLTMAGIRALVDARKNVMSLALVGLPEKIHRVLELAGTTDFFAIYQDEEAALRALNSSPLE
jgi:anti-anti-sigma factor